MVCSDVAIEPVLQDTSGKHLNRLSNKAQEARLDIHARGFWERHWSTFFDVRVCHPNAVSCRDPESHKIYRIHENEKKRLYCKRVLDIEHRIFTPLVFTTTGGMGKESLMYHSRLAQLIAKEKKEKNHPCFAKSCVCCVHQRPLFRSILGKSRCISKQRDWCGFENSFSLAKYRIRASFQQFGLFMAWIMLKIPFCITLEGHEVFVPKIQ